MIAPDSSTLIGLLRGPARGRRGGGRFVGPRIFAVAVVGQTNCRVDSAGTLCRPRSRGGRVPAVSMLPLQAVIVANPVKESDTAKEARPDAVKTARRSDKARINVFQC